MYDLKQKDNDFMLSWNFLPDLGRVRVQSMDPHYNYIMSYMHAEYVDLTDVFILYILEDF